MVNQYEFLLGLARCGVQEGHDQEQRTEGI